MCMSNMNFCCPSSFKAKGKGLFAEVWTALEKNYAGGLDDK